MLHARRKRLVKLAQAEARGESFWTKKFSQQSRTRLWYALLETSYASVDQVVGHARRLVMTDEGMLFLSKDGIAPTGDFYNYWFVCDDDMMPTLLEAVPGHSDIRLTLGTYAHPMREVLRDAAEAMDRMLSPVVTA